MITVASNIAKHVKDASVFETTTYQTAIATTQWFNEQQFSAIKCGTGSGKTFIGLLLLAMAQSKDSQKLLYVVPLKNLRDEVEEVLRRMP